MWTSPNGETRNEIDYILTNKPGIFCDLSVLNSVNTGSNDRMVQGRAKINTRIKRTKLIMQCKKIDTHKLHKHQVKLKTELWKMFNVLDAIPHNDLDATADAVTKIIHNVALLVAAYTRAKSQTSY